MTFQKKIILIVTILLVIVNFYGIYNWSPEDRRICKFISSTLLFIFLIGLKGYKNKSILLAFFFFCISDFCKIQFGSAVYNKLAFVASIFACLTISWHLYPKLKFSEVDKYVLIVFILFLVINSYMLYELINMIEFTIADIIQPVLLSIYGFSLIVMGLFAGMFHFRQHTTRSLYCLLFAFTMIFSDVFEAMAHFFNVHNAFYPNRLLYFVALLLIILYAITPYKKVVSSDSETLE